MVGWVRRVLEDARQRVPSAFMLGYRRRERDTMALVRSTLRMRVKTMSLSRACLHMTRKNMAQGLLATPSSRRTATRDSVQRPANSQHLRLGTPMGTTWRVSTWDERLLCRVGKATKNDVPPETVWERWAPTPHKLLATRRLVTHTFTHSHGRSYPTHVARPRLLDSLVAVRKNTATRKRCSACMCLLGWS